MSLNNPVVLSPETPAEAKVVSTSAPPKPATPSLFWNFANGAISGCLATCVIQPVDMVKTRIQILAGENPGKSFSPFSVAKDLYAKEGGFKGFYRGIDSAFTR